MKILVTGGVGRLGAKVVASLVNKGHHVNIFDLPQTNYRRVENLPNTTVFKGDITSLENLKLACEGVDAVIHLAAILPPYSEKELQRTILVNVTGTTRLLEALELTSSAPLFFSSSVCVYGQTQLEKSPISSSHPLMISDNYSKSKIQAEEAIKGSRIKNSILRLSAIYAAEPFEFPSPVQFKADQRVEFIDQDDVIRAFVAAVEGNFHGSIMNIAGGSSWRMMGENFITGVFEAFGFEGSVDYPSDYGYFDWYDTDKSQQLLEYQKASYSQFKKKLTMIF
ncbi:MAG: Epimerase protein [Thermoproteota archaeon]|nr:Epimerase protein [Thermoproteota archaeon]